MFLEFCNVRLSGICSFLQESAHLKYGEKQKEKKINQYLLQLELVPT